MKVLVTGGTGTVGSQVVAHLLDRDADVRVMTRSPEKIATLPPGAEGVVGNMSHPGSLGPAFAGADLVFLLTPLAEDEVEQGMAAMAAAAAAGARKIVYMSVHNAAAGPHIPHFASKVEIMKGLRESGIPHVVIEPNDFFQNDVWLREPITQYGLYPSPIGSVGLSRVDVRDIAQAAVNALLQDGHEGKAYPLVGPDVLTGEETAAVWAEHLGRDVRYGGDDVEAWAGQVRSLMPEWLVRDLCIMFEHFQQEGLVASDEDLARQREVLGLEPRSFHAFAAETAERWRS
jgi:uncharacterized protein YbjT (DUF2867 family)